MPAASPDSRATSRHVFLTTQGAQISLARRIRCSSASFPGKKRSGSLVASAATAHAALSCQLWSPLTRGAGCPHIVDASCSLPTLSLWPHAANRGTRVRRIAGFPNRRSSAMFRAPGSSAGACDRRPSPQRSMGSPRQQEASSWCPQRRRRLHPLSKRPPPATALHPQPLQAQGKAPGELKPCRWPTDPDRGGAPPKPSPATSSRPSRRLGRAPCPAPQPSTRGRPLTLRTHRPFIWIACPWDCC